RPISGVACVLGCAFFFQAEDGIRDFHVTGVQTCALPICTPWWPRPESWEGVVLCLETSEAAPPVTLVGRFLRNYGSQGILERAAALLLARPMRSSAEQHWRLPEEAPRVLAEFGRRAMPVVANLDLGHTSPQTVLPFGCMAEVDPVGRRVVLLEPGVA